MFRRILKMPADAGVRSARQLIRLLLVVEPELGRDLLNVVSAHPMETIEPTLPNTASRMLSSTCFTYWFASVRLNRYLRASERMVPMVSVT